MTRRLVSVIFATMTVTAVPGRGAAADWTFEERSGPTGKVYSAKAGTRMGLECGRGATPSLWVTTPSLAWKELAGAEAVIDLMLRKTGVFGLFGRRSEGMLLSGRYDQKDTPTFATARVTGGKVFELARKMSEFDEVALSIDAKGSLPTVAPTRAELTVAVAGAGDALGKLLKSCPAGG